MIDNRLKNYFLAVHGLRRAPTPAARREWATGFVALTAMTEPHPRLSQKLHAMMAEELYQKPA